MDKFNVKAASLALASAMAAMAPFVHGYFSVTMELGNDIVASVGAQKFDKVEVLTWRIWTLDEDCNEVELPAYLDNELIEMAINDNETYLENGCMESATNINRGSV